MCGLHKQILLPGKLRSIPRVHCLVLFRYGLKKLFVKKSLTKINLFNLDSKSCCQPNTMKNTFLFIALLLQNFGFKAQIAENDSLQGFDLPATVIKAHQMNLTKEELKFYINTMKRDYIIEKFYFINV